MKWGPSRKLRALAVAFVVHLAGSGPLLAAGTTAGAATLEIAALTFQIPSFAESKGVLRHQVDGWSLLLKPSRSGSSRTAFELKIRDESVDEVDPDGPLALRFESAALEARGEIVLANGVYTIGRERGALLVAQGADVRAILVRVVRSGRRLQY